MFTNTSKAGLESLIVKWLVEQNKYEQGHNHDYSIFTGEGVDVRCCGRVIGAVSDGDIATGSLIEKIEAAFDEEDK